MNKTTTIIMMMLTCTMLKLELRYSVLHKSSLLPEIFFNNSFFVFMKIANFFYQIIFYGNSYATLAFNALPILLYTNIFLALLNIKLLWHKSMPPLSLFMYLISVIFTSVQQNVEKNLELSSSSYKQGNISFFSFFLLWQALCER